MCFVVSAIAALTVIKKLSVWASISCFEYYYAIDLGKGVYYNCVDVHAKINVETMSQFVIKWQSEYG